MQEMDLKERALELQEAAAARMARTPTARKSGVSPVALAIQARLGELDKLKTGGGLPDPAYQEARLRIITGGQAPRPRQAPKPRVPSYTERRTEERERADAISQAERLEREMNRPKVNPAFRQRMATQLVSLVSRATERWGEDWKTRPGAAWRFPRHLQKEAGATITPWPYDGKFVKGKLYPYQDGSGRVGIWRGEKLGFTTVGTQ